MPSAPELSVPETNTTMRRSPLDDATISSIDASSTATPFSRHAGITHAGAATTASICAPLNRGHEPPPHTQQLDTGTCPRFSRAAFTGCACNSICVSLRRARHVAESTPCGIQRSIDRPTTTSRAVVDSCCGEAARTYQRDGDAAMKRKPSARKNPSSATINSRASTGDRSSTAASTRTLSRPVVVAIGSAHSQ